MNKEKEKKEKKTKKATKRIYKLFKLFLTVLLAVVVVAAWIVLNREEPKEPEIITVSSVREIIDVSELYTFKSIYNGVVAVYNEQKPESIDYYVSYEATVKAGIDFKKVGITLDEATKVFTVTLPAATIQTVGVDISSLDYLIYNEKLNTVAMSADAYKICEEDATNECNASPAICEFARENAIKTLEALLEPFVAEMGSGHTVVIQ